MYSQIFSRLSKMFQKKGYNIRLRDMRDELHISQNVM